MADERKSLRINVVDILITLVIIVVLTTGIMVLLGSFNENSVDGDTVTVEYTVVFKKERVEFSNNINTGNAVTDAESKCVLGKVKSTVTTVYSEEIYDEELQMRIAVKNPDYVTVEMRVSAEAVQKDGMYYLKDSGKEIGFGTELKVFLPDFYGIGYVSDMKIA